MIRKRIAHGDHVARGLPGERGLAAELGLSRQTVRRAIQVLTDEGVFRRGPTGRLQVAEAGGGDGAPHMIALLHSGQAGPEGELWREGVYAAVEARGAVARSLSYEHYGDAIISMALDGFDGVFWLPRAEEPLPEWLARRMQAGRARVVALDQDESAAGLRSVLVFPSLSGRKLLAHLRELGHLRIDCLNVQAENPVILRRIEVWREFIDRQSLAGQLVTESGAGDSATGHRLVAARLQAGLPVGTAVYCTTVHAAVGAMRALHEHGLRAGRDVSVCAVNDEGLGPYLVPSLTCLQTPRRARYLEKAVAWMLTGEKWARPSLHQPAEAPLFVGESTGPAPAGQVV